MITHDFGRLLLFFWGPLFVGTFSFIHRTLFLCHAFNIKYLQS